MWVRKRIEIKSHHLAASLGRCFVKGDRQTLLENISRESRESEAFICLSVRSGFDLLLQNADWPVGSEILMSGLTIPDMRRIVEQSQYVPVGVDVDLRTLAPRIDEIEKKITNKTKAIVVAHLFGGLCPIQELAALARRHNLLLIEDCAQAYVGEDYQGASEADISMFSFGPIKTNTALGGGVFRVRHPRWKERLEDAHEDWPHQSRWAFGKRLIKYGVVKAMSTRMICGGFYRWMRLFGSDHDRVASKMARGFAGPRFFDRIRQQPCTPLLWLLNEKLRQYSSQQARERNELGRLFISQLGDASYVLGSEMQRPTFWVLPILVDQPEPLIQRLWAEGFDASHSCSLESLVESPDAVTQFIMQHIVFLPFYAAMPRSEIKRMAQVIREFAPALPQDLPLYLAAARSQKTQVERHDDVSDLAMTHRATSSFNSPDNVVS